MRTGDSGPSLGATPAHWARLFVHARTPLPLFLSCCFHVSCLSAPMFLCRSRYFLSVCISVSVRFCLYALVFFSSHLPIFLSAYSSLCLYLCIRVSLSLCLRPIAQDLSSHLRGVLATQAVLEGMGVGRAGSTPLAATLQWMARDGEQKLACLHYPELLVGYFLPPPRHHRFSFCQKHPPSLNSVERCGRINPA